MLYQTLIFICFFLCFCHGQTHFALSLSFLFAFYLCVKSARETRLHEVRTMAKRNRIQVHRKQYRNTNLICLIRWLVECSNSKTNLITKICCYVRNMDAQHSLICPDGHAVKSCTRDADIYTRIYGIFIQQHRKIQCNKSTRTDRKILYDGPWRLLRMPSPTFAIHEKSITTSMRYAMICTIIIIIVIINRKIYYLQ